jgi:glutathione S-transferase
MSPSPATPIVLYRYGLSGHCHRVEVFMRMLGLPLRLVDVDLVKGEQRQPAFLALNRYGKVPVIDDNGTVLVDSMAILVYLALRYAAESWLPREPVAAARVQQWLSLAAGPLVSSAAMARATLLFGMARDTSAAVKEGHWLFKRMDAGLAADAAPWLAGNSPTIADLAMYTYTAHAPEGGIALDDYPALRAWLARVEALPGFEPMPASAIGLRMGGE